MSKSEILKELASNTKLKRIAQNIAKELGGDLFQDLFLTLANYDEKKIKEAHKKKYIEYLCISIMSKTYHAQRSSFTKDFKFSAKTEQVREDLLITDPYSQMEAINLLHEFETDLKPVDNFLEQEINQQNFYNLTLVKRWIAGESYREISRKTKIPVGSIAKTIQGVIKELKQECL